MDYVRVFKVLSTKQPLAFLDGFLGDDIEFNHRIERAFYEDLGYSTNPLSNINDNVILEWCSSNSSKRYPMVAAVMQPYRVNEKSDEQEWTPLADNIICNSPDPVAVLKAFKSSFRPMSWSGSRADIMSKFLPLITSLKNHDILLVAEWATAYRSL